jgi:hypothetical protein
VRELFPGVHHWTAVHPAIALRVSSCYVEPAGVVIDPILPEDGLDAFAGRDRTQRIVLTSGLHTRGEFATSPVGHEDHGQAL